MRSTYAGQNAKCKLLRSFRCKPNLTGLRHALLREKMQGCELHSSRFRRTKELTALRHVYCRRKCKAAKCFQTGFGGNRISLVGEMLIAGENAKLLIIHKRVSLDKGVYWLETCLLHGNVQSRFPFSNRFRWKQNLTGWRHAYCRRKCKAANCFQTGFGGNRISLVGEMLIAGECAKPLPVLKQVSVEREPYWFETGLLREKMQSC